MPLHHVLLYHFRDDTPDARIDEHLAFIEGFRECTPGLLSLRAGRNICPWSDDYSHGFVMTFTDADALAQYGASARHSELVRTFRPWVDRKSGFDFETTD
jgi:hypothetical protein